MDFLELEGASVDNPKETAKQKKERVAKKKERISKVAKTLKESYDKKELIRNCKTCKGNPLSEHFEVQGTKGIFKGLKCVDCFIVISYKNE